MRLIDADMLSPDRDYYDNSICSGYDAVSCQQIDSATTVKAIPIPDNATNGDMVKAMFPNLQIVDVGFHRIVVIFGDYHNMMYRNSYDEDWWNAPYMNESEEQI